MQQNSETVGRAIACARLHLAAALAFTVALAASGAAQALQFQPLAGQPESPSVTQLLAVSDSVQVAVTETGNMVRSVDGGVSWNRFGGSLGHNISAVAYGGGVYYVAALSTGTLSDTGVFASSDNGVTWQAFSSGLPTEYGIYNLGRTLLADASYIYVGANYSSGGIYRSPHGAAPAWQLLRALSGAREAVLAQTAGTLCLWSGQEYRFGVEYSSDGGMSWTKGSGFGYPASGDTSNYPAPGSWAVTVDGSRIYTNNADNSRLYGSSDGCKTWTSSQPAIVNNSNRAQALGVSQAGSLYVSAANGSVYVSDDGGSHFADASGADFVPAQGLVATAFSRIGSGLLMASNGDGVFSRSAGGWLRADQGFNLSQTLALQRQDSALLALLQGGGLNRLQTGLPAGRPGSVGLVRSLAGTLVTKADALYVGIAGDSAASAGVFKSSDGGASWTASNTGLPEGSFAEMVGPASTGGDLFLGFTTAVYRSSDGAANWSAVSAPFPQGANTRIRQLATVGGSLLAYINEYSTARGVYRSVDSGASFVASNTGLTIGSGGSDARLNRFYVLPSGVYLQPSTSTLFRSTDAGQNWAAFDRSGLPTSDFYITAMSEDAHGTLYLSYAGPDGADLYYRAKEAVSWTRDRSGLPRANARTEGANALLSDDTGLYAAVRHEGIYRSELAPGSTPPTADTVPDAFDFIDQTEVPLGVTVTSNEIVVSGIDAAASIGVGDIGEYSINGGAFTKAPGSVVAGDHVRLRHTSGSSANQTVVTVLTIGGIEGDFRSTTVAVPDFKPKAFAFTDVEDAAPSTKIKSNKLTPKGYNSGVAISVSGGEYRIMAGDVWGAWTTSPGQILPGNAAQLRLTSASTYQTPVSAMLTVGGVSSVWTVTTRNPDTVPAPFTLVDQTGVAPASTIKSNKLVPTDFEAPAPVSVLNGQYRLRTGDVWGKWTTVAGTIAPGQALQVSVKSAQAQATTTSAVLDIGGVSDSFDVTTAP